MILATFRWVSLLGLVLFACSPREGRSLDDLVVRDRTYVDPETMTPYSGQVFRFFPGKEETIQLRASLRNGTWEGELTVYHPTGRIRYQGEMSEGMQCGGWTENERPAAPESLYEEIKEDLASLVMYPPCPNK